MLSFNAKIYIIGINPYVLLPQVVLKTVFKQAGKEKGTIPVRGTIDGYAYIQTLVKYSGKWRLYLNTPMRKAAKKEVGDTVTVEIEFDPAERIVPMHPKLAGALKANKQAGLKFKTLSPSRQKEIIRYINYLKTEESVDKNIARAIQFLSGKESFAGRNNP